MAASAAIFAYVVDANRSILKERFSEALRQFCHHRGISQGRLAELLQVPKPTAVKWHSGQTCPRRSRMKEICTRLNFDYQAVFEVEFNVTSIFQRTYLSFSAINQNYLDTRGRSQLAALASVAWAGSAFYARMMDESLAGQLVVNPDYRAEFRFLVPGLEGYGVGISGEANGICMQLIEPEGSFPALVLLTDDGVNTLVKQFQNYGRQHESGEVGSRDTAGFGA
jgi:transcriptional regulator with XRE-family HTH domain